MPTWPVQDAKARFSEFLERCLADGPQIVTRRGTEAAVLVRVEDWRRMQAVARPTVKQLLLSDAGRAELPARARWQPAAWREGAVSMYLLDTNVVSELRKPKPHGAMLAWLESAVDESLFVSAVTVGEIQAGIELTREQDAAKAAALET